MGHPRILVLRGGAIGDMVLTFPVLQALRKRWPGAEIDLIGYSRITVLAREAGLADNTRSLERAEMAQFFSMRPDFPDELRDYIKSFDFIISYLYDPSETLKENMVHLGARQFMNGSPHVESCHAIEHLMKPLENLAIYPEGGEHPDIRLSDEHLEKGRERVKESEFMVIHPGSGSELKNWSLECFLETSKRVRDERGYEVYFTVGEADRDIEVRLAGSGVNVIAGLDLVELAETIGLCSCFLGNDSGVTHMAAGLGVPCAALFGSSDPGIWGPRGENVRILTSDDGLSGISVDEVVAALRELIPS